jgi:hypothetical protein
VNAEPQGICKKAFIFKSEVGCFSGIFVEEIRDATKPESVQCRGRNYTWIYIYIYILNIS